MLLILSPSKSMDFSPPAYAEFTQPRFLDRSAQLVEKMRTFSEEDLMQFMAISRPLAELNRQRFTEWARPFSPCNAKQALFAFTGDVYDGLDGTTLSEADRDFAQKHLLILSGLYGLLRPMDLIQPYRLEMGRSLEMEKTKTLYDFWRPSLTEELNKSSGNLLINLASLEYFKAIDPKQLNKKIINPVFKDEKNGRYKIISFYAKRARGSMARFIIRHQVKSMEGLLAFEENGYRYAPELSSDASPVFTRSPEK